MMLAAAGLFGALLGLLLALALLTQRRGPVLANRRLGWLLLASAAAAGSIAGSHLLAGGRTLLLLVELIVALAVGPLLLAYVQAALRPPDEPVGRLWPHLLPAAAAALYALGALAAQRFQPAGWGPWLPPIPLVIAYQALYTAAAAAAALRRGRKQPRHPGAPGSGACSAPSRWSISRRRCAFSSPRPRRCAT